jgi:hypothetical protein
VFFESLELILLPFNPAIQSIVAWGLWGANDERGTLNLLTKEVVRAAGTEVSLGRIVSLKYVPQYHVRPYLIY